MSIEELKRLCEAATPNWEARSTVVHNLDETHGSVFNAFEIHTPNGWVLFRSTNYGNMEPDAKFIAALNPTQVLELIKRLEEAEANVRLQRNGLEFYACGKHLIGFEDWDTVSGEGENWLFPSWDGSDDMPEGVEDGSVARMALTVNTKLVWHKDLLDRTALDLSEPEDARAYVARFVIPGAPGKPTYIELNTGKRITFATMDDEEACVAAHLLHDLEVEAVKKALKN
jgi:hypothetical protein